ncbi:MAG: hypothetical protein ABSH36_06760 [Solirubrobacteraceae bacterium]
MSARRNPRVRVAHGRLALLAGALATAIALVLSLALPGSHHGSLAVAQPGAPEEALPQTDSSMPAREVTMIGATLEEPGAPGAGETWGIGHEGSGSKATTVLVRYYVHPGSVEAQEGTWTLGPALPEELPKAFKLAASPLAGQMTPKGFGALVGAEKGAADNEQVVLVRKPGGAFEATGAVPVEGEAQALLLKGQRLYGSKRAPMLAPLEEAGGEAGALVAPVSEEGPIENEVLHWDGHRWSGEPIEVPANSSESFRVLAIGASSPTNAWLLAALSANYPSGAVALFRRVEASPGHWSWKPVALTAGAGDGEAHPLTIPVQNPAHPGAPPEGEPLNVPGAGSTPAIEAQLLTVTSEGVWVDGARGDLTLHAPVTATLFFKPEGSGGGTVESSWCQIPAEAPSGTPPCEHELPEQLPLGPSRSIAWANGSRFGERVITGLPEGVSLRLEGESFKRVLALGSSEDSSPGGSLGAAFSTPTEGWLGYAMPVHLALAPKLQPSRLQPWPVSFRHPLVAVAPEPGAPVGALTSGALAVGENGAVARYKPGEGWLPESLLGPGGRDETKVRLRAVAWPTPHRAYAVGEEGEMWLWRAETGLWERDPATPINFRANLYGIAFDPANPARGYAVGREAVGQGGVLLRYGKTWTEETGLPPQVQGATFNSIAFAGSEAIVAYSKQPNPQVNAFVGGLLVNEGAGWRVDQEAETVAGAGSVPRAVAGLPDGGAAFVVSGGEGGQYLYEREAAGAPWRAAPTPLPGSPAGALALFRENGALRAVVTAGGNGLSSGSSATTPGFPPPQAPTGGLSAGPESGGVLRQTATGWRDESHELNPVGGQEGSFVSRDLPYRPDPIFAVLVGPTGTQGWAVGGISNSEDEAVETADVERYPADGVTPLGTGASPVASPGPATFAFGGEALCAAPCSDRADAGVGPQVWLRSALALASRVGESGGGHLGAFFDTGPTVTAGTFVGSKSPPIPFADELEDSASIFSSSAVPVYDTMTPDDLDARPEQDGSEASWEAAFAAFPRPFGGAGGAGPAEEPTRCGASPGCESAYYAVEKEGVWVLVLDDSQHGDVNQAQREWVERRLGAAGAEAKPVIVVANANLGAQVAAHDIEASRLLAALVGENPDGAGDSAHYVASAYFYDSPEANVQEHLNYNGRQLAAFGSGTLGYELLTTQDAGNFHGAKGILLGHVHTTERKANDEAPVSVQLIPVIGELALEANDGTLLRRSSVSTFEGLARRPRAGCRASESGEAQCEEGQYTPIPSLCVVAGCQTAVLPEYELESSDKEVGRFVERNTASSNPHEVLQNAKGEPISDEREAGKPPVVQSGLFCAFNPGTTTVTIRAGGLSASLPVTVEAGSVREPCGTVPLKPRALPETAVSPPPPPPPPTTSPNVTPASSTPPPVPLPPPPPPVLAPVPTRPLALRTPAPPPFFVPLASTLPAVVFVPPPLPPAANPTPPSGTSAVTSPVEAAQKEEEEEEATESVSNQAVAYRAHEHEPAPVYLIGLLVLAAFAGASTGRRSRRRGTKLRVAPATVSSTRAQRRMAGGWRGRQ